MNSTTPLLVAAALALGIATGCSRMETEEAAADAHATAVDTNAAWSPEVVASPAKHTPDDGEDHTGHDH